MMIIRSDVKRLAAAAASSSSSAQKIHAAIQQILARPRIESYSQDWLKERKIRITATNTASIITNTSLYGKSPFRSRQELFLLKTGRAFETFKPFVTIAMNHGTKYEAEAAEHYTKATGIEVISEDIGMLQHPTEECISATPDRLARYYPINIEIKCPFRRKPEHKMPPYYYAQVQHQMAVLELQETHFVQYIPPGLNKHFPHGLLDIVVIPFDPEWWAQALFEIKRFFQEIKDFYESIGKPLGTLLLERKEEEEQRDSQGLNKVLDCSTMEEFIPGKRRRIEKAPSQRI